jgi:hypothetical protein
MLHVCFLCICLLRDKQFFYWQKKLIMQIMEADAWIFMYIVVKGFGLKPTRFLNLLEKKSSVKSCTKQALKELNP